MNKKKKVAVLPLSGAEPLFSYMGWGDVGRTRDNCYDYAFGSDRANRNVKSVPGNKSPPGRFKNSDFTSCRGFTKRVLSDNPGNVYRCKDPRKVCKRGFYKVMAFVAPTNDYGNSTGDFHWYKQHRAVRYRVRAGDTVTGLARFFKVSPLTIKKALTTTSTFPKSSNDGFIADTNMVVRMKQSGPRLVPGRVITFPINAWSHKQGWATGPLLIDASGNLILDPRKANRKYGYNYSKFCSAYCVRAGKVVTGKTNLSKNLK